MLDKVGKIRLHSKNDYRICTVWFLIFMALCNCKIISFFVKWLNQPLNDFIQGRRLELTLESTYLKCFRSSLQSHPLWVILYNNGRTPSYIKNNTEFQVCITNKGQRRANGACGMALQASAYSAYLPLIYLFYYFFK